MENELKVHIEKLNQLAIQLVIFTTRKLEKTLFLKNKLKLFIYTSSSTTKSYSSQA